MLTMENRPRLRAPRAHDFAGGGEAAARDKKRRRLWDDAGEPPETAKHTTS
jgi:hypothetical protein